MRKVPTATTSAGVGLETIEGTRLPPATTAISTAPPASVCRWSTPGPPATSSTSRQTSPHQVAQFDGVVPGGLFIVQNPWHTNLDGVDAGALHRLPRGSGGRQQFVGEVAFSREISLRRRPGMRSNSASLSFSDISPASSAAIGAASAGSSLGGGGRRYTSAQRERQWRRKQAKKQLCGSLMPSPLNGPTRDDLWDVRITVARTTAARITFGSDHSG